MTDKGETSPRMRVMRAAADILENLPYETVTLGDIADLSGLDAVDIEDIFGSMHELGSAILTYEGESMRAAQRLALDEARDALDRLRLAFRYVGENLANDSIVRAGVRIAGESHHRFPERKINPFRTWRGFITSVLDDAREEGSIQQDAVSGDAAWLLTAAGLGTKDLLTFTRDWREAPALLERVADQVIHILRAETPARNEKQADRG